MVAKTTINEYGTNGDATADAAPYSGPTGTITGVISYNGTPPAPKKIDTSADPVCGQKNPNLTTDDTIVKDGKLANVFVYIKEGTVEGGKKIGDYSWPTPTTAVQLDQNGCHYAPHVMGLQVNQKTQHHQQRRHAAQHPPDTEAESGMEPDAAQRRASNRKDFRACGSADSGQMQPASVDEGLHRRHEAPVLRSQQRRWRFRDQGCSARHIHRRCLERRRRERNREDDGSDGTGKRQREG